MSMRVVVEYLNGESLDLEVTAGKTVRELNSMIRRKHTWQDELSRDTTLVDLIVGDKKVADEETVEELGLCDGSKVTVVFRKNVLKCCDKEGLRFGPDLDLEVLVIVEMPDTETEIKPWAFRNCRRLAKVIIPSSVTRIGPSAFFGCRSFAAISIPDSVTWIGSAAFRGCSALVSVDMPGSVTQIGSLAFYGCTSLVTINMPNSVTRIDDYTFTGCVSLLGVNIPDYVTQIGSSAFARCSSLTSVHIPDSVTDIARGAFSNCRQLTLTAPARLLETQANSNVYKLVAKECGCGQCVWRWFQKGWLCPAYRGGQQNRQNAD